MTIRLRHTVWCFLLCLSGSELVHSVFPVCALAQKSTPAHGAASVAASAPASSSKHHIFGFLHHHSDEPTLAHAVPIKPVDHEPVSPHSHSHALLYPAFKAHTSLHPVPVHTHKPTETENDSHLSVSTVSPTHSHTHDPLTETPALHSRAQPVLINGQYHSPLHRAPVHSHLRQYPYESDEGRHHIYYAQLGHVKLEVLSPAQPLHAHKDRYGHRELHVTLGDALEILVRFNAPHELVHELNDPTKHGNDLVAFHVLAYGLVYDADVLHYANPPPRLLLNHVLRVQKSHIHLLPETDGTHESVVMLRIEGYEWLRAQMQRVKRTPSQRDVHFTVDLLFPKRFKHMQHHQAQQQENKQIALHSGKHKRIVKFTQHESKSKRHSSLLAGFGLKHSPLVHTGKRKSIDAQSETHTKRARTASADDDTDAETDSVDAVDVQQALADLWPHAVKSWLKVHDGQHADTPSPCIA